MKFLVVTNGSIHLVMSSVNAHVSARQSWNISKNLMYPLSLGPVIFFWRTAHNTCVFSSSSAVKTFEVSSIESQHSSFVFRGKAQDRVVRYALVGIARLVRSQDVMTQCSQFRDQPMRDILI